MGIDQQEKLSKGAIAMPQDGFGAGQLRLSFIHRPPAAETPAEPYSASDGDLPAFLRAKDEDSEAVNA